MDYPNVRSNKLLRITAVLFCLTGCFIFVACSNKKETAKDPAGAINLTGTWELREAQNGMMPAAQHAAGNGNRWQFTETTFEQYTHDTLARNGSYSLVPDTTVSASVGLELPKGKFTHRIIFDRDTTEKTFVDVRGDSMTIVSGFFPVDAGSMQVYVKTESSRK